MMAPNTGTSTAHGSLVAGTSLRQLLPEIHHPMLGDFFDRPAPDERNAGCASCSMLAEGEAQSKDRIYFSPQTKCCTYHPHLPNYLIGAALADGRPEMEEGRRRLRERILRGYGVWPLGILKPRRFHLLYRHSPDSFGQTPGMVCPFYLQHKGTCSLWSQREALCRTWFCKHVHGRDAWHFWRALRMYLQEIEWLLSQYAVNALGWCGGISMEAWDERPTLSVEDLEESAPSTDEYTRLWGEWSGREEALYLKTSELVKMLGATELQNLGGLRLKLLMEELHRAYEQLVAPPLPRRLKRNPQLKLHLQPDGGAELVAYSSLDPQYVSGHVYKLLDHFDGSMPHDEVCRRLRTTGLPVPSRGLLVRLYQHRVLIEA